MTRTILVRVTIGLLICVVGPYLAFRFLEGNVEITWRSIFLVSGAESLWVYLCWDISKWIRQAWEKE